MMHLFYILDKILIVTYNIDGRIFGRIAESGDLGVFFVLFVVSSGFKLLGFVVRNSKWLKHTLILFLFFNALVRTMFEYDLEIFLIENLPI